MSESGDQTDENDERGGTDVSELNDQGLGATATEEPNTMEPEEGLPEEE